MSKPTKLARGHAIVIVIGGEYRGSVIDASVVWNTNNGNSRQQESLIEVTAVDSKNAPWRRAWNWAKKDIKWASQDKLDNDQLFDDGVEYSVDSKTRKAIKEHDGAWVIRLHM